MSEKPTTLRLRAGEGALVRLLGAMRNGRVEYVGMRLNDEATAFVPTGAVTEVTVGGAHATADLAAYRKDALAGHAVPDDEATAAALGVPFQAPAAPPAEPDVSPRESAAPAYERPDVQTLEATLEASPWGDLPPAGPGVATELREAPSRPPEATTPDAEAPVAPDGPQAPLPTEALAEPWERAPEALAPSQAPSQAPPFGAFDAPADTKKGRR